MCKTYTTCTNKKLHNSVVSVLGLSYHWKTVCIRIKVTAKSNYNTFFQHFSCLRLLQSNGKKKLISTICLVIIQWFTRAKVISQFGYIHAFSYTDPFGDESPNSPLASLSPYGRHKWEVWATAFAVTACGSSQYRPSGCRPLKFWYLSRPQTLQNLQE